MESEMNLLFGGVLEFVSLSTTTQPGLTFSEGHFNRSKVNESFRKRTCALIRDHSPLNTTDVLLTLLLVVKERERERLDDILPRCSELVSPEE